MYKRKYALILIPLVILSGCSTKEKTDSDIPDTNNTSISVIEDNDDAPAAPQLPSVPTTSISVKDNEVIEKFDGEDQDVKDKWFYKQLDEVGISYSRVRKNYMRNKTCDLLEENNSIDYVIDNLTEFDLDEKQFATLISSSMITQCSDNYATVKQSDIDSDN